MSNTVTIICDDLHGVSHNGEPIMVTENMFGGIYTTFQSKNHALGDYGAHSEALGVSGNIRFPGGTFANTKIDEDDWDNDGNTTEYCYDLANDDLNLKAELTGDSDFGLSGTMEYANDNGLSLTIIVPVARYYDNPEEGMEVFEAFLEKLYIDQTFGIPADKIILEFGNEDIVSGDVASAVSYATMTDEMLTVLGDFIAENPSLEELYTIEVAVQTGRDPETDEAVRACISEENYDLIDYGVQHYLNNNIRGGYDKAKERGPIAADWEEQFGDDIQMYASAWSVGSADGSSTDYKDFGAAAGRTTITSFVQMLEAGVTIANAWGIDINEDSAGNPVNANAFSSGKNGEVELSHNGFALQMLSETTIGKTLLEGKYDEPTAGKLIDGEYPGLEDFAVYPFQGPDEITIFVTANMLEEATTVSIDLSSFQLSGSGTIRILTSEFNDPENPLDDVPIYSEQEFTLDGTTLTVDLSQSYQVVCVTLSLSSLHYWADGVATSMEASSGDDFYFMDHAEDTLPTGDNPGVDQVESEVSVALRDFSQSIENLTLLGSSDIDGIGNRLDNIIHGNSGDNYLNGGDGADTIYGGSGNDILWDDGKDLTGDTLIGGEGDDIYYVNSAADIVIEQPGEGHDLVYASVSYALYTGNKAIEDLTLTGTADISGSGNNLDNVIRGNSGNNFLNGGYGDDTLYGGDGNDKLQGNVGDDIMYGGKGDDIYYLDSPLDRPIEYSGEGNDLVYSSVSTDLKKFGQHLESLTLTGSGNIDGSGNGLNNIIEGNDGDNILNGRSGSDTLIGGAGNDIFKDDGVDKAGDLMVGGTGDDIYYVDSTADRIVEFDQEGFDIVYSSVSYSLKAQSQYLEDIYLTGDADIDANGNRQANVVSGNSGDNFLNGGEGIDTLIGGAGDDVLWDDGKDRCADTLIGGIGNDTYYVDNAQEKIIEHANEGYDIIYSSVSFVLSDSSYIEEIRLQGGGGLSATGNAEDNLIVGNSGANFISGMAGADQIVGGKGDDTLSGGSGPDTFIFYVGDGNDTIVDFSADDELKFMDANSNPVDFDYVDTPLGMMLYYGEDDSVLLSGVHDLEFLT